MVAAAAYRPRAVARSWGIAVEGLFDLFDDEGDDEADSLIGIFLHLGLARAHQDDEGHHYSAGALSPKGVFIW